MRIQGELLKLGIGVSPTTIAAVLRSSGLGPAPRRIGPTWSEFLRAQAHSMLGGGLRDSLDGDTFEPSGWAADRGGPPGGSRRQRCDRGCRASGGFSTAAG
jgi:hypothetical protein